MGLPKGEGFCVARVKDESLFPSHTILMQLRKKCLVLDNYKLLVSFRMLPVLGLEFGTPGTGKLSTVLYARKIWQVGARTSAERQRLRCIEKMATTLTDRKDDKTWIYLCI